MVKFILFVGLPGSGKTTLAKKMVKKDENAIILSSDETREELFGNENNQDHNGQVFNIMNERTKKYLRKNTTVYYDATNINSKRRWNLLQHQINDVDCYKECIYLNKSIEECIIRDKNRDRTVGKEVILKMRNALQIPMYFEGWDNIIISNYKENSNNYNRWLYSNNYNEFCRIYSESFKLNKCIEMPQDNPYHTFSLSRHMYKTYEQLNDNELLSIAGSLHDIGKAYCKQFGDDGYAHYYGHDNISGQMALDYLIYHSDLNLDNILYVVTLIQLHMRMFNVDGYDKLRKMIGNELFQELLQLHNADVNAK